MVFQSNPIQKPMKPKGYFSKFRNKVYVIANSEGLEWVINLCIIWRSVLMAMRWYEMPEMIDDFVWTML
jgi:hypothetical protein